MTTTIAEDGKPLDYTDDLGRQHVMAACGHRVTNAKLGERNAMCPNCTWLLHYVGTSVTIVYPSRLPENVMTQDVKET